MTNRPHPSTHIVPAQVKGPKPLRLVLPSPRHRDFLALLDTRARIDQHGRRIAWGLQANLAAKLGCSTRTLRRIIADLREPGRDPRHLKVPPAGLRLGLINVIPTHTIDPTTGRHRLGADLYVLLFAAGAAVGMPCQRATQNHALTSNDAESVALDNKKKPSATSAGAHTLVVHTNNPPSVTTWTWPPSPPVEQPTPAPVLLIRRCSVCGERCQADQSQHIGCQPSNGTVMREQQLRATLERAFGHDISVEVNDRRHVPTRDVPDDWQWTWQAKRTGRCVRCSKWAHTNGPDDQAWHPFCWALPDVPVLKDTRPPDWWRRR